MKYKHAVAKVATYDGHQGGSMTTAVAIVVLAQYGGMVILLPVSNAESVSVSDLGHHDVGQTHQRALHH